MQTILDPRKPVNQSVDAAENPSRLRGAQTMAWHFFWHGARRCPLCWQSNSKPHRNELQNIRLHKGRCVPTPVAIELGAPSYRHLSTVVTVDRCARESFGAAPLFSFTRAHLMSGNPV
jgi:hypothetical protein